MIIRLIKSSLSVERKCKRYAQDIGLRKGEWVFVFTDFVISRLFYSFCSYDYFVIGNGYTLSRYEKKGSLR